jgi:capsular exopolysaccharide synthesis family protein
VDADMRRPTQHHLHQLDNDTGLSVILQQDDVSLEQVLRPISIVNLSIITSGPPPDNPSDLLGSERMDNLIDLLLQQADIVIFDCPPVEAASDAISLASRLDGALLVVDAGHTRRASAQRSRDALMSVGANLLGVVLNRLATSRSGYYYYSSDDGERKRRSKRASLASLFGQAGHSAEQTVVSATLPGEPEASDEEPTRV